MNDYPYGGWEEPNISEMLAFREATTTANVGSYTVPLGSTPLTREIPVGRRVDFYPCYGNKFCDLYDSTSLMRGTDPQAVRMY